MASSDPIGTGTFSANGEIAPAILKKSEIVVRVNGTTPNFDVKFYGSDDNGVSYHAVYLEDLQTGSATKVTSVASPSGKKWYRWTVPVGHNKFKVTVENYVAGSCTIDIISAGF